ncbi:hypothetical protein LguiB_001725 [Lonicera macranthoides]
MVMEERDGDGRKELGLEGEEDEEGDQLTGMKTKTGYETIQCPESSPQRTIEAQGAILLLYRFSGLMTTVLFFTAELNKPVAKNGLVESGVPTNVKKSSGSPSTEKQKHHYLLLQV